MGIILLLSVVAPVAVWAGDYGVKADVVEKRCANAFLAQSGGVSSVVVRTRIAGYERAVDVRPDECLGIPLNAFVVYHLRTHHTLLYESEGGRCLYDSTAAAQCG